MRHFFSWQSGSVCVLLCNNKWLTSVPHFFWINLLGTHLCQTSTIPGPQAFEAMLSRIRLNLQSVAAENPEHRRFSSLCISRSPWSRWNLDPSCLLCCSIPEQFRRVCVPVDRNMAPSITSSPESQESCNSEYK